MKKSNLISLIILSSVILSFYACKQVQTLSGITFSYTYNQDTLPLAPVTSKGNVDLSVQSLSTDITTILSDNGVSMDHFKSARIKSLTVKLIDTSTVYPQLNFNFLSRLELYIKADGKPKKLIAGKEPIAPGSQTLVFDIYNVDLIDYFKKDNVTLTFNSTVEATTNHDVMLYPVMTMEFTGDIWK